MIRGFDDSTGTTGTCSGSAGVAEVCAGGKTSLTRGSISLIFLVSAADVDEGFVTLDCVPKESVDCCGRLVCPLRRPVGGMTVVVVALAAVVGGQALNSEVQR